MAENETYTPAAPRVNATDMGAQNKQMDAAIQREVEHAHKQRTQVQQTQADAAQAHKHRLTMGPLHPLRPVQRAVAFSKGTVHGTLSGIAYGGRKGGWLGLAVGALACVALGSAGGGIALIPLGFIACASAGAVVGGVTGFVAGGLRGLYGEVKAEYGADARAQANSKTTTRTTTSRVTTQELRTERKARSVLNYDRYHQQDLENQRDKKTYWQDHVSADAHGWGRGL